MITTYLFITGSITLIVGIVIFWLIEAEKTNCVTFKFQGRNLRMTKAQKEQWDLMDNAQQRRAIKDLKKVLKTKGE